MPTRSMCTPEWRCHELKLCTLLPLELHGAPANSGGVIGSRVEGLGKYFENGPPFWDRTQKRRSRKCLCSRRT